MAYATTRAKTSISFPQPVSFVVDLTIPNFSTLKALTSPFTSKDIVIGESIWHLHVCPLYNPGGGGMKTDSVAAYSHREIPSLQGDRSEVFAEYSLGYSRWRQF